MTTELLKWKPDLAISVPSDDHLIAIHRSDWQRLQRHVTQIPPKVLDLSNCYSILFGVAGSAGLSIIPIASTKDLLPWVAPLYIMVFLAALFLAIVLVIVNARLKSIASFQVADLASDIHDIESRLQATSSPPPPASTTTPPAGRLGRPFDKLKGGQVDLPPIAR
jgi:hypothetical protein